MIGVGIRHYASGFPARSSARYTRPSDSTDLAGRAHARLGHLRANPADLGRSAAGEPRVAVPGAPPFGTPELDQGRMGHFRARPAGPFLSLDRGGTKATGA